MCETGDGMQDDGVVGPPFAWLVVNTHPHREKLALENLHRQDFTAYCPQVRRQLRARTGPRDVLRPLFPSYVFVRVSRDKTLWRPVLSTYGVRHVVRFGDAVPYLDPRFVDTLRSREVNGAVVKPPLPYVAGQEIRIAGGAFDGIVARILEVGDNDRLVILMDLLGQSVRARIHADQVSPPAAR